MQNWIHATNQKQAAHSWMDLLLWFLAVKPHSTSSIFQIFNTVKNCFVRMNHHTRRLTKQSPFSCNASIVVFPKQLADPFSNVLVSQVNLASSLICVNNSWKTWTLVCLWFRLFVFQSLGRTVQVIAHVRTALDSAYALMSHSMPNRAQSNVYVLERHVR